MAPGPELDELHSLWRARGIDVTSLAPDSDGTIRPPSLTLPPTDLPATLELPPLSTDGGIAVGDTLGQGGMGVVKRARQLSLGREVAVKIVRDPDRPERAAASLLREARVTGVLEHPNVIPVHALYRDEHGAPAIVMKRIDGVAWTELIRDPKHPARPGDEPDLLEFHLGVFLQVCRAVEFAHSKRIIHRDLKPDNVMIGAFGEVYVLDWGLALTLGDEPAAGVPRSRDVSCVAGTPQYMAPEQVVADAGRIDERTDIYQLGGILHECVTGRSRHAGKLVAEILEHAFHSAPVVYEPSVPEELAAICNRAMAADPKLRFQSVSELRNAVLAFRRHRSASALARESRERLAGLQAMLEGMASGGSTLHEIQIHSLFSECRFGFQQALAAWPESVEAREGLRAARVLMVEFELSRGNLRAATVMAAELDPPSPELNAKVRELRARVAQEAEQNLSLRQLKQDMDLEIGASTRVTLTVLIGILFGLLPLGLSFAVRAGALPYRNGTLGIIVGGFWLFCLIAHVVTRGEMSRTEVNRRIVRLAYALCVAMLLLLLTGAAVGLEAPRTMVLLLLGNGMMLAALSATLDLRILWAALVFAAGAAGALYAPAASLEISAATNLIAPLLMALSWRRRPPAPR